jgi:Heterokaryon incompatibility protein (HET)
MHQKEEPLVAYRCYRLYIHFHRLTGSQLAALFVDRRHMPHQADEIEKAQQISVMRRIFEEANMVHIWLGPEDCMTAKLFVFLQEASLLREVKMKMASDVAILMKKIFVGGDGLRAIKCLIHFSHRPWFSRRWIIQEACLA